LSVSRRKLVEQKFGEHQFDADREGLSTMAVSTFLHTDRNTDFSRALDRCQAAHPSSVARRLRERRRGFARAALRGLARDLRDQPVGRVEQAVRDALTPLGVPLAPAEVTSLAEAIAAGRSVELR
jgi:hypothetical protein